MTARPTKRPIWLHLLFLISLLFLLLNRWLMATSGLTGSADPNLSRVLGASGAYLLIWAVAYWLCLKTPGSKVLPMLGVAALPISVYSAPLAGYILLALMAVIGRHQRAQDLDVPAGAASRKPPWPLRISPFRILSILFWGLLLLYFFSHSRLIAAALVMVLVLLIWSRLSPISARIAWVLLTTPFSGAGRRGYNEYVARIPQIKTAEIDRLVRLLNTTNPYLRPIVADEIQKRGDQDSIPLLMDMLPSLHGPSLGAALSCIGHLASPSQATLLVPFVEHVNKHARRSVARYLGRLANPIATQPLGAALAAETDPGTQAEQFKALLQLDAMSTITPVWTKLLVADRKRLLQALMNAETDINTVWEPVQQLMAKERSKGVQAVFAHLRMNKIWADTRKQFPDLDTSEKAPKHLTETAMALKAPLPGTLWPLLKGRQADISPTQDPLSIRLQLHFEHRSADSDDSSDIIRAEMAASLPLGGSVTVAAYFSTEDLFEAAADRRQAALRFLPNAPERWQQSLANTPLAHNLYYFDDGRDGLDLHIDDQILSIRRKYFACRMDVAADAKGADEDPTLLVCLKGVFECEDYTELPPFVARVDLMAFLCAPRKVEPWDEISEESGPISSPQIAVDAT